MNKFNKGEIVNVSGLLYKVSKPEHTNMSDYQNHIELELVTDIIEQRGYRFLTHLDNVSIHVVTFDKAA